MNDLLGGHVPVAFGVLPPAMGNIQSGTLRAIAVFSDAALQPVAGRADRDRVRPAGLRIRCCTTACSGRPACRARSSTRSTPNCASSSATDEVKQRIQSEGGDPLTSTPEEYAADIDKEETKWSALIRKLSLKVE